VPELGNLTACIFLPPSGLSTVKIRTGSLFCTFVPRIGASEADSHPPGRQIRLPGSRSDLFFLGHSDSFPP